MCFYFKEVCMPLSLCPVGSVATVKKISGCSFVRQHLIDLGFRIGSSIIVVSTLRGNLIVKVKESRIAIDKSMAMKIYV